MSLPKIVGSPIFQRLSRGLSAQGYGHAVTIGLQLATVPVLLHAWGEARYGAWLLLSVLPTYLLLSDLGFAQAATNDMTMTMARQDVVSANRTFQSLLALCLGVGGFIVVGGSGFAALFHLTTTLNLRGVTEHEAKVATVSLATLAALAILNGGLVSSLRAEGRFATMALLNNTIRLCEGLASMVAAIAGGGVVEAALAMLTVRVVGTVLILVALKLMLKSFAPGLEQANIGELKRLMGPSIGYMAFPVGNALMIQGVLTLIGLHFPASVALYGTSRTLARIGANVLGSVNHVFLYDYGRTLGSKDRSAFFRLMRVNGGLIFVGLTTYALGMGLIGPWFYQRWTGGKLHLDLSLLYTLVAVSAAETIWAFLQTPLFAVNAHAKVATSYLVGAGATLAIGASFLGKHLAIENFVLLQAAIYLLLTALIIADLRRYLRV